MVKSIFFAIITLIAFGFLIYNLSRFSKILKLAQPDNRFDRFWKRLGNLFKVAIFQSKILREPVAGFAHVAIFWGFLVLLFSASEAVFQGFYQKFSWSFLGFFYTLITFSTDIFCVFVILGVIVALFRRFVIKVKRLQGDKKELLDALVVLLSILFIVTSLLLENSAKAIIEPEEPFRFAPISAFLSSIYTQSNAQTFYNIFWWMHILLIYAFMNYLFYSKHFHVYTSIQNVFFREPDHFLVLKPIDFEKESLEKFGVVDFEDLSWKSVHDGFSCTHCGRCDSVCPANITGKVLSPRQIIIKIRERAYEKGTILIQKDYEKKIEEKKEYQEILAKKFVGDYQNIDALWQCTTCGACMYECPITIEHLHPIIGMRQSLVMMEAQFPSLLQNVFSSLENNGAPWQFSASDRELWKEGLDVPLASDRGEFEYLFWVGCMGSFDERAKKIARAFAKILTSANVNFAILGNEEVCNGDLARRLGNEYLANYLINTNISTFEKYAVKKIITICPHCYNIFKNEYPLFGGNYEVIHHTQFIQKLLSKGKIILKKNSNSNFTYHDSCYLGRYNNIYQPPREILKQISNKTISEPQRSKDKGLCCGAGGGMMFLEETEGKRINIERIEELLNTGANTIASNCPFCMTMLVDGLKAKDKEDEIKVKDIAEIVAENLE